MATNNTGYIIKYPIFDWLLSHLDQLLHVFMREDLYIVYLMPPGKNEIEYRINKKEYENEYDRLRTVDQEIQYIREDTIIHTKVNLVLPHQPSSTINHIADIIIKKFLAQI